MLGQRATPLPGVFVSVADKGVKSSSRFKVEKLKEKERSWWHPGVFAKRREAIERKEDALRSFAHECK
jgi:hypothetical protein